jgi:hypothetical protein
MGWLSKNRLWEWNRYNKSLLLYKPLSLFAVFGAAILLIELVVAIVSQF